MPGSSILPVAFHKGKLYFLFGKENPLEDSAPGFSDFGGGVEKGETVFETAMREGGEELTGFLGDGQQLKRHIKRAGKPLVITRVNSDTPSKNYTVHVMPLKYDPMLPVYYNNNHRFLWNRMNHSTLSATKLFEKIEIAWFSEADLRKRMSEYRPFYREVVEMIIQNVPKIRAFTKKCQGKMIAKTRRNKQRAGSNKTLRQKGG